MSMPIWSSRVNPRAMTAFLHWGHTGAVTINICDGPDERRGEAQSSLGVEILRFAQNDSFG